MIDRDELSCIGTLGKPHGLRGELTALITTDVDLSELPCAFVELDGLMVPFFIESFRTKGAESVLITFDGIDSQEKASAFSNKDLFVRTCDLGDGDSDDEEGVYLDDLIGYGIVSDGLRVGTVTDFDDSTDNYLFSVETDSGGTLLVPANPDLIESIDTEAEIIYMNLPQGLTDL